MTGFLETAVNGFLFLLLGAIVIVGLVVFFYLIFSVMVYIGLKLETVPLQSSYDDELIWRGEATRWDADTAGFVGWLMVVMAGLSTTLYIAGIVAQMGGFSPV